MAKGKIVKKISREQRKMRFNQIVFVAISVIILLTMVLSLVK